MKGIIWTLCGFLFLISEKKYLCELPDWVETLCAIILITFISMFLSVIMIKQLLFAHGPYLLIIYIYLIWSSVSILKIDLKKWKSIYPQLLPIYSLQLTSFQYETLSVSKYQNRTEEHHSKMMHSSQIYWGNLSNKHVPNYCLAVWMKWWMLFIVWTCWSIKVCTLKTTFLFLASSNKISTCSKVIRF